MEQEHLDLLLIAASTRKVRYLWEASRLGPGVADLSQITFPALSLQEAIKIFTRKVYGKTLTFEHPQGLLVEEKEGTVLSVYTFGDSILDCGHYNAFGVNPGQLLVHNDDHLFPEFHGHDLSSLVGPARLMQRAQDGATVSSLPAQAHRLTVKGETIALLTIGGNDLLSRPDMGQGPQMQHFAKALESFLHSLPIRPIFLGNVYDPTFGDDSRNFLDIEPSITRQSHRMVNDVIAQLAKRYGALVDLHAHFLTGDPSWFTQIIEPSLRGASEIRHCFLPQVLAYVHR